MADQDYTSRVCKKVTLEKQSDEFVVRALPDELGNTSITDAAQVSSVSSYFACGPWIWSR
jgi:hypothetical protein